MERKILLIGVFSILLIGIIIFIIFYNKSSTLKDFQKIILTENKEFYENHKKATLDYLIAVYPNGKDSLEKLSTMDLAKFYNSLWFYYNCDSKFNGKIFNTDMCWQPLPGCGDKYPKLPYTPQGFFYSLRDWVKNWTPWIETNSNMDPSYFTAAIPGFNPFTLLNDTTVMAGPGPLFMFQRGLYRMVYNTEIPKISVWTDGYGNDHITRLPKMLTNKDEPDWKIPNNWWKGAEDNSYIEVTGADEPGMPISGCAIWVDGWRGSGIFYNVGRSLRCRNKVDAIYLLAKEMSEKYPDVLRNVYDTIDPYDIISMLLPLPCKQKPPKVWDPDQQKVIECNWCNGGGWLPTGLPRDITGFSGNVFNIPATDWFQWCNKTKLNTNPKRVNGLSNECIDDIRFNRSGIAERIAAQGPFDEGMTWMGIYLKYDTIQESQSSNGNGNAQVEILELRNYPPEVKDRDYSAYIQKIPGTTFCNGNNEVMWRTDTPFLKNFMAKTYEHYSLRDPLDIFNDSKASKCVPGVDYKYNMKFGYNITCKNNISDMFTRLTIAGLTTENQCSPDGIGFNKEQMTTKDSEPWG